MAISTTIFLLEVTREIKLEQMTFPIGHYRMTHRVVPVGDVDPALGIAEEYENVDATFDPKGGAALFLRYLPTILPHAPPPEVINGITAYDLGMVPLS